VPGDPEQQARPEKLRQGFIRHRSSQRKNGQRREGSHALKSSFKLSIIGDPVHEENTGEMVHLVLKATPSTIGLDPAADGLFVTGKTTSTALGRTTERLHPGNGFKHLPHRFQAGLDEPIFRLINTNGGVACCFPDRNRSPATAMNFPTWERQADAMGADTMRAACCEPSPRHRVVDLCLILLAGLPQGLVTRVSDGRGGRVEQPAWVPGNHGWSAPPGGHLAKHTGQAHLKRWVDSRRPMAAVEHWQTAESMGRWRNSGGGRIPR